VSSLTHRAAHLLLELLRQIFERLRGIAIKYEGRDQVSDAQLVATATQTDRHFERHE
jgi:hypothetical protein